MLQRLGRIAYTSFIKQRCDRRMACCCNNQCCCCHCVPCCNCCKCNCCNCTTCRTCQECKICPVSGCPDDSKHCEWYPIKWEEDPSEHKMRICCDESGCCGLFPEDCRNIFWPDFAHPRWLCCKDLYCARKANQAYCKK